MSFKNFIIVVLLIQMFYGFAMTMLAYGLSKLNVNNQIASQFIENSTDYINISIKSQETLQTQKNVPLLDLGALVFYSGNILVDFLVNFFTAIPSMISSLVGIFAITFNLDSYLAYNLKLFLYSFVVVIYIINLIILLLNIRSRGVII